MSDSRDGAVPEGVQVFAYVCGAVGAGGLLIADSAVPSLLLALVLVGALVRLTVVLVQLARR